MTFSTLLRAAAPVVLAAAATVAAPAQAAVIYSVTGTTQGGPTYNRPNAGTPPTTLSTVGTAVAYNTFLFSPSASGTFNFLLTSATAGFDPFLALYSGVFNPAAPLNNVLVANDDLTTGNLTQSGFSRALASGTIYTAVITGFNNDDFGNYTLTISDVASPVPEAGSWALMLLGFGLLGAGTRYRRRTSTVRFA